MQIHVPGNDGGGVRPGRGGIPGVIGNRHHVRHAAVQLHLLPVQIPPVLGVKCAGIHKVAGRSGENLGVPGPSIPLVTLRAVRRHIHKIPLHAPFGVQNQTVHQRVGGGDLSQLFHVRVNHKPPEIFRIWFSLPAFHLHKPESVECKVLPDIPLSSVRNISKLRLRTAEIFIVKIIILQDLAELEIQFCSGGRLTVELQPTHHVLSHIKNRFSGRRLDHFNRFDLLMYRNCRRQPR